MNGAPGALTYTVSDWQTAQTVMATAVDDENRVNETITMSHTATAVNTDTEYNFAARVVEHGTVQVTDNDTPNLTGNGIQDGAAEPYTVALLMQSSGGAVTVAGNEEQAVWVDTNLIMAGRQTALLSLREDKAAAYTVQLTSEPVDPVVVRIGNNTDVHAMPRLVQFNASDWNTAQPVTVRADAAVLTHRAAGAVKLRVTSTDADVVDTDTRPGVWEVTFSSTTWNVP